MKQSNVNVSSHSNLIIFDENACSTSATIPLTNFSTINNVNIISMVNKSQEIVQPGSRSIVQQQTVQDLNKMNERIALLLQLKQNGLLTTENEKQLNILLKQKKTKTSKLKYLQNHACAQKRLREKQKKKIRAITESYPDAGHVLKKVFREDGGRPPIDDACRDLLSTIEEIAAAGGAGDDRRRTEVVSSCLTLDDLREQLKAKGYDIKRTTLYYR